MYGIKKNTVHHKGEILKSLTRGTISETRGSMHPAGRLLVWCMHAEHVKR